MNTTPNILFFFPDQWRHDWMDWKSDLDIRTPNLERLSARGTTFVDTFCPSPLCAPSRASLALGVEYDRCPVKGNHHDLPLDRTTVYNLLRDAGYHTMGCGKFDLHKATYRWGLDGKTDLDAWGFADGIDNEGKIDAFLSDRRGKRGPYMHELEQFGLRETHIADNDSRDGWATHPTELPEDAYCDNWIGQNGLDLLDNAPAGKPWFLQVNFTGPHSPWDVTESMRESVRDRHVPPPVHASTEEDPRAIEIRRNYVAMLENLDRWIGIYLDRLEERGELENTLIVFASDHGEMLLDHDLWGKGTWRHASVGVPMIVAGPTVKAAQRCAAPTELLDLAATFLDAAGSDIPADWDARSLAPVLRGEAEALREQVVSGLIDGKWNWRLAADKRWKLVRDGEQTLLFDRRDDPEEIRDVSGKHPEVTTRLSAAISKNSGSESEG